MGKFFPQTNVNRKNRGEFEMRLKEWLASLVVALISCQGNACCLIALPMVSYFHEGTLASSFFSPDSPAALAREGASTTPTTSAAQCLGLKNERQLWEMRAWLPSVCLFVCLTRLLAWVQSGGFHWHDLLIGFQYLPILRGPRSGEWLLHSTHALGQAWPD